MEWEEDRGIVQEVGDKVREAKAQIELSLAVDIEDNRKGFYRYIASKRKTRGNLDSLPQEIGHLATLNKEKAEVLDNFYTSFFNSKCPSHATLVIKDKCRD